MPSWKMFFDKEDCPHLKTLCQYKLYNEWHVIRLLGVGWGCWSLDDNRLVDVVLVGNWMFCWTSATHKISTQVWGIHVPIDGSLTIDKESWMMATVEKDNSTAIATHCFCIKMNWIKLWVYILTSFHIAIIEKEYTELFYKVSSYKSQIRLGLGCF